MSGTPLSDTIDGDSERSPAPATEELAFRVVQPRQTDIDELIRQFPEAAEFLGLTSAALPRDFTVALADARHDGQMPVDDTLTLEAVAQAVLPAASAILERGEALEICQQFEEQLKQGVAPLIEDRVHDVSEPQRTALLSMLVATELRFRVRSGERPQLEAYRERFPDHAAIVAAVFARAVGPERIGPFGVVRLLGTGNFGRVYLCRDEELDRLVAVKVPRPGRFSSHGEIDRFLREARLAAKLSHPGIVTVHQVNRDPNVGCFVVLEYIAGRSLATRLRNETINQIAAAEMVVAIAEALAFAHATGLVHRDLKPANILLDAAGRPHVADFGLALHENDRWPTRGEIAGTPPYMAPEQVRGEGHRLDGRTDIWGIGVTLYRMLTGHRPFEGKTTDEIFKEILEQDPVPPRQHDRALSRELERICLKCLAKRMSDRYATASALAEDLRDWLRFAKSASETAPSSRRTSDPNAGGPDREDSGVLAGMKVRPKGLRAFDVDDRDFFLGLLPGPRDRDGLPESIRFWKTRIEPGEHEEPFHVGLLCGPSGSGKTSLIKAGLLCRLSPLVVPIYIEASPDATESQLKAALDIASAGKSQGLSLAETIAGMRGRVLLPPGRKILIVLDQFEQWLHADHDGEDGELVQALRHCDGANVQCLILVREDFAIAAARFMRCSRSAWSRARTSQPSISSSRCTRAGS